MLIKQIRNKIDKRLEKTCKICADTECLNDNWIMPCACKGSLLWCHENCLKTWIKYSDSKRCNICKKDFHIEYKNPYLIYIKKYVPIITYYISINFIAFIVIKRTNYQGCFVLYFASMIRKFFIFVYLYYVLIYFSIKYFNKDIIGQIEFNPFSLDYFSDFLLVLSEIHKINKLVICNKFLKNSEYKILNYKE
jgi:E3 ubiquitin-protein ligase DOA10